MFADHALKYPHNYRLLHSLSNTCSSPLPPHLPLCSTTSCDCLDVTYFCAEYFLCSQASSEWHITVMTSSGRSGRVASGGASWQVSTHRHAHKFLNFIRFLQFLWHFALLRNDNLHYKPLNIVEAWATNLNAKWAGLRHNTTLISLLHAEKAERNSTAV
jgi:hypothetical protein